MFKIEKFIPISILLISISSVNQWSNLPIENTYMWWAIYMGILIALYQARLKYYDIANNKNILFLRVFLGWNIICIIRGCFVAENYWEWKTLVGATMVMFLPLSIYVTTNKFMVQKIVSTWIRYGLILFILLLPFLRVEAIGRFLAPIAFLLLFFSGITKKWRFILLFFTLFVFLSSLAARSNILKFTLAIGFAALFYIPIIFRISIIKILHLVFIMSPFVLILLGISGRFNVFKMDEYIDGEYTASSTNKDGETNTESLTTDSRTGIYEEVINSAIKYDYVVFGRTPARGNESDFFGDLNYQLTGKRERYDNEVSILNIFTRTGVVGVILYFLVFFRASYLAVYRSNNIYIKIIGLYVSFRWLYAWIEDFSWFDLAYFFLWIMIGMSFSKAFRQMNNKEMIVWIRGIFSNKYRILMFGQLRPDTYEKNSSYNNLPQ